MALLEHDRQGRHRPVADGELHRHGRVHPGLLARVDRGVELLPCGRVDEGLRRVDHPAVHSAVEQVVLGLGGLGGTLRVGRPIEHEQLVLRGPLDLGEHRRHRGPPGDDLDRGLPPAGVGRERGEQLRRLGARPGHLRGLPFGEVVEGDVRPGGDESRRSPIQPAGQAEALELLQGPPDRGHRAAERRGDDGGGRPRVVQQRQVGPLVGGGHGKGLQHVPFMSRQGGAVAG